MLVSHKKKCNLGGLSICQGTLAGWVMDLAQVTHGTRKGSTLPKLAIKQPPSNAPHMAC